jgi:two-component system chemotaxis response regulator CheY
VLRQIRQEDPQAKIVMVSAVDQKGKLAECIRLGAVDFIVKPFDKTRLENFFAKYGREAAVSRTETQTSQPQKGEF